MCVCIHYCLVKILQWLPSAFAYWMQYCALICPSIMPTDLESADMAHFAVEASESRESGAFTPERARGSPFVIIFGGADSFWPTLGAEIVEAQSTNANEICCFPPVGFQGFPGTWCNWGKKWLDVIYFTAVSWILSSFHLQIWNCAGIIIILYFLWRLFSWKDYWISGLTSVWILDSSLLGLPTKPYINLLSIANDSDHTVTWARHSTCLTGSCQKYLSFCQTHSLATTTDSMFFYKVVWSCTQLCCSKGR